MGKQIYAESYIGEEFRNPIMKFVGAAIFVVGISIHFIGFPNSDYWLAHKWEFIIVGLVIFALSYKPQVITGIFLTIGAINLIVAFFADHFLEALPMTGLIVLLMVIFSMTCKKVDVYKVYYSKEDLERDYGEYEDRKA